MLGQRLKPGVIFSQLHNYVPDFLTDLKWLPLGCQSPDLELAIQDGSSPGLGRPLQRLTLSAYSLARVLAPGAQSPSQLLHSAFAQTLLAAAGEQSLALFPAQNSLYLYAKLKCYSSLLPSPIFLSQVIHSLHFRPSTLGTYFYLDTIL